MIITKIRTIKCGKKELEFPCIFPSVSSIKTSFRPEKYITFLNDIIGYPNYLISAYDVMTSKDPEGNYAIQLPPIHLRNNVVILDSGNYESWHLRDETWDIESYFEALGMIDVEMCFSFDDPWGKADRRVPFIDQESNINTEIIPIIHGKPLTLPQEFQKVVETKEWKLIAIPDRELGDGVIERCETLLRINQVIESQGISSSIHILGTVNPLSILLYVACGVISFDGLEWCQTVIHPKTGYLLHFSQRRLITCDCVACDAEEESYSATTLAHNLFYYMDWIKEIKQKVRKGNLVDMLRSYISNEILSEIGIGGLNE